MILRQKLHALLFTQDLQGIPEAVDIINTVNVLTASLRIATAY